MYREGRKQMISQKATLLCIYEILKEYSDEKHILSAEDIRKKLKTIYDVDMERRAIYRNIDALRSMDIEIEGYAENRQGYYLVNRKFELSEVRVLCDAVVSSDRITEKAGKEIIGKLIATQSIFQRRTLQKTVFVKSDQKIFNKQLFYNIDVLNEAIGQGCKVSAKIMEYGLSHELEEKENSSVIFSPYVTLWAEGEYYILAKREESMEPEHIRIDLLRDIEILEIGMDMLFGGFNPGQYAQRYIIQNGERKEKFEIECAWELWQDVVENFGRDAFVCNKGWEKLNIRIETIPSKMESWVMQHIDRCEVIGPRYFKDNIQNTIRNAYKQYFGQNAEE